MTDICSVEGCGKPKDRCGFCCAHYMRNHRYGSPTHVPVRAKKPVKICSVAGCERQQSGKGMCGKHYMAAKRHGDPLLGGPSQGFARQFFWETASSASQECIFWPYAKGPGGYAAMAKMHGTHSVHRAMCIEVHGPCPSPDHEAAHSCGRGNMGCVNPNHLSWKTRSENQMDRARHGTSNRGTRQWNAKLKPNDVIQIVEKVQAGVKQSDLARHIGIGFKTISDIMRGKTWGWLTGIEDRNPRSRILGVRRG